MPLPKFFRRPKGPQPSIEKVPEPGVSWHFQSILDSQRFVKVAARDMIERRIRKVTLENAEAATHDLRAALEAGDELALHASLRRMLDVGVVLSAADQPKR